MNLQFYKLSYILKVRIIQTNVKIKKNENIKIGWGIKFRTIECRTTDILEFRNYECQNNKR